MTGKCWLCHVEEEGETIPGAIIATWDKYWKEIEGESKKLYSHLPVDVSIIIKNLRDDYVIGDKIYFVCQKCMKIYIFDLPG